MNEIWKDVEGFPRYKVSNFGRVKGKFGKILRLTDRCGYSAVNLSCDQKQYKKYVFLTNTVENSMLPKLLSNSIYFKSCLLPSTASFHIYSPFLSFKTLPFLNIYYVNHSQSTVKAKHLECLPIYFQAHTSS